MSSRRQPTRCGPPAWGLVEVLTTPQRKIVYFTNYTQIKPRTSTRTLVQPKQRKRDMRFGTWNVRSLYRAGSCTAAARELARKQLGLVGVQEVR
jgi:hypothetical protein